MDVDELIAVTRCIGAAIANSPGSCKLGADDKAIKMVIAGEADKL
jgi:hypothetical protein